MMNKKAAYIALDQHATHHIVNSDILLEENSSSPLGIVHRFRYMVTLEVIAKLTLWEKNGGMKEFSDSLPRAHREVLWKALKAYRTAAWSVAPYDLLTDLDDMLDSIAGLTESREDT